MLHAASLGISDLWCCSDLGDSFQKHLPRMSTEHAHSSETRMNASAGIGIFLGFKEFKSTEGERWLCIRWCHKPCIQTGGIKGTATINKHIKYWKYKDEKELHGWTLFDRSCTGNSGKGQMCGVPFRLKMKRLEWMSKWKRLWCCEGWKNRPRIDFEPDRGVGNRRVSVCSNIPACLSMWYYTAEASADILTQIPECPRRVPRSLCVCVELRIHVYLPSTCQGPRVNVRALAGSGVTDGRDY